METVEILGLFDLQLREKVAPDGLYVGDGWSAVLWPPQDGNIEPLVARMRALTGHVEWKYYSHDAPIDLPSRLIAAGLAREDEETVLVAEATSLPAPSIEVTVASTPELVEAFLELASRVFGREQPGARRGLLDTLGHERPSKLAVVALEDGAAVSGGRIDFEEQADFAGLFGGITLPEFRGRGLYRATVAKRAALARDRGYRYLYVDALPTSRPILERLGFVALTTTTPFTLPPAKPPKD